jgi:hypothetical protein
LDQRVTLVAIHQPNFFPWLGYFDKIIRSDVFVVLDTVQHPKTGGGWSNRVQCLAPAGVKWLTAPLDRTYSGVRTIAEMEFSSAVSWRDSLLRALEAYYRPAAFINEAIVTLEPLIRYADNRLLNYNLNAICALLDKLGFDHRRLKLASEISATGTATELLVSLVKSVGGTTYLAGGGASGYQQDELFDAAGIDLAYQNYLPRAYAQQGAEVFRPGLSVIDALMNVGVEGVRSLLEAVESR